MLKSEGAETAGVAAKAAGFTPSPAAERQRGTESGLWARLRDEYRRRSSFHRTASLLQVNYIFFFSKFYFKHKNNVLKKRKKSSLGVLNEETGEEVFVFLFIYFFSCDKDLSTQSLNAAIVLCWCCEREP